MVLLACKNPLSMPGPPQRVLQPSSRNYLITFDGVADLGGAVGLCQWWTVVPLRLFAGGQEMKGGAIPVVDRPGIPTTGSQ